MRLLLAVCVLIFGSLLAACTETSTNTVSDGTFDFGTYRPTAGARAHLTVASISKVLSESHQWTRLDCRPLSDELAGPYVVVFGSSLHSQNNWLRVRCQALRNEYGDGVAASAKDGVGKVNDKSVLDTSSHYDVLLPDQEDGKACGPQRIYLTIHDGVRMLYSAMLPGTEQAYRRIALPRNIVNSTVRIVLSCGDFARDVRPE